MIDTEIQTQIIAQLDTLPLPKQQEVLDFARGLSNRRPKGVPGYRLLRFAGMLTEDEAVEFLQASEECRKVDLDEW
jgi:hypothetical protein